MLPPVISDKKVPFFSKNSIKVFLGKTSPEVHFFKDSRCCPKILGYTLSSLQPFDNISVQISAIKSSTI